MKNILALLLVLLMMMSSGCGIIQKTSDLTIEDLKEMTQIEPTKETESVSDVVDETEDDSEETEVTEQLEEIEDEEVPQANISEESVEKEDDKKEDVLEENVNTVTFKDVNETVYAITTVNIRAGSNVNDALLATYHKGDSILRTGIGDNGWSRVWYNNQDAYMWSEYISTTKPVEEKPVEEKPVEEKPVEVKPVYEKVNQTVYATTDVNVRTGPSTSYDIYKTLSKGDSVTRVGIGDNGWSKISLNNKEYFVKSSYLSTNKPKEEPKPPVEETKPEVTFRTVSDYMYSGVKMMQVRKGPGEEYVAIGGVCMNGWVHRIGISDTGWSKIEFTDTVGYVLTSELSAYKIEEPRDPSKTVAQEMAERSGMIGRLTISDVNLSVALFGCPVYQSSQSIVDKKDSAAYLYAVDYYGYDLIADHNIDGFEKMKSSVVGKTIAVIDYGTYTQKYICTANFTGWNNGSALIDNNGNDISGTNDGGITMYTCNAISGSVTITFWQPI